MGSSSSHLSDPMNTDMTTSDSIATAVQAELSSTSELKEEHGVGSNMNNDAEPKSEINAIKKDGSTMDNVAEPKSEINAIKKDLRRQPFVQSHLRDHLAEYAYRMQPPNVREQIRQVMLGDSMENLTSLFVPPMPRSTDGEAIVFIKQKNNDDTVRHSKKQKTQVETKTKEESHEIDQKQKKQERKARKRQERRRRALAEQQKEKTIIP